MRQGVRGGLEWGVVSRRGAERLRKDGAPRCGGGAGEKAGGLWRSQVPTPGHLSETAWEYHLSVGVVHIPEAEAARDLSALMQRVYAGEEIVIDNGSFTVALKPVSAPLRRSVAECIALARKHEETTGETPVLDADFAADVEGIVRNRKPWGPPAWD